MGGGGGGGGGGTISAEGGQYLLADYVRGGQFPLADYVRGDKICGGTESAPTPDCTMATTAALSHRHRTTLPRQSIPQIANATTIGNNSFAVIFTLVQLAGHWHVNHSPHEEYAPQPHTPDASDVTSKSGHG